MTRNQIELISHSWSKVAWQSPGMVSKFHIHLFNRDHEAQSLFVSDNGAKVTGMMKVIDVAYGVLDSHYPGFGDALMLTLGGFLGPDFTPDTQDAWAEFYGLITQSMIEGSKT
jgi:nitric oxide dioxygenase